MDKLSSKLLLSTFASVLALNPIFAAEAMVSEAETKASSETNMSTAHLEKISKAITSHEHLFREAKGKDITVFLGNTGVGKSSLINLLANSPIDIDDDGQIVLSSEADKSLPRIGKGYRSVTKLPHKIEVEGLGLLYDMPGFMDTDGHVDELINLSYIRSILTYAKSVKAVWLTSRQELEAGRGKILKALTNATNVFKNDNFRKLSCLFVVNQVPKKRIDRGNADEMVKDFLNYLKTEKDSKEKEFTAQEIEFFEALLNSGHTHFVGAANGYSDDEEAFLTETREGLLKKITSLEGTRLSTEEVRVSLSLRDETPYTIKEYFKNLMEHKLREFQETVYGNKVKELNPKVEAKEIKALSVAFKEIEEDMWEEFEGYLKDTKEYSLLYPLTDKQYHQAQEEFRSVFSNQHKVYVNRLELVERKAAEEKMRQEKEAATAERDDAKRIAEEEQKKRVESDEAARKAEEEAEKVRQDHTKTQAEKDAATAAANEAKKEAQDQAQRAEKAQAALFDTEKRAKEAEQRYKEENERTKQEFAQKLSALQEESKRREMRYEEERKRLAEELKHNKQEQAEQLKKLDERHAQEMRSVEDRHKTIEAQMEQRITLLTEEARKQREEAESQRRRAEEREAETKRQMDSMQSEMQRSREKQSDLESKLARAERRERREERGGGGFGGGILYVTPYGYVMG